MIEVTIQYSLDDDSTARSMLCPDVEVARSIARGLMASKLEQFAYFACGWVLVRSNGRDEWHKDYLPSWR